MHLPSYTLDTLECLPISFSMRLGRLLWSGGNMQALPGHFFRFPVSNSRNSRRFSPLMVL